MRVFCLHILLQLFLPYADVYKRQIQGFARLLKTKNLTPEEFDEYTDVIINESMRLERLSSNMLRLSRLENQTIPEASTEFSLDEQIRNTLLLLENEWTAKNLELDIDMESVKYTGRCV